MKFSVGSGAAGVEFRPSLTESEKLGGASPPSCANWTCTASICACVNCVTAMPGAGTSSNWPPVTSLTVKVRSSGAVSGSFALRSAVVRITVPPSVILNPPV